MNKNIFETMETPTPAGPHFVQDGDIIDLTSVQTVEDKTYTFDDGTMKLRKIYRFNTGNEIVIPVSLHAEIINLCKANIGKVSNIQVKTEGSGKMKRYRSIIKL